MGKVIIKAINKNINIYCENEDDSSFLCLFESKINRLSMFFKDTLKATISFNKEVSKEILKEIFSICNNHNIILTFNNYLIKNNDNIRIINKVYPGERIICHEKTLINADAIKDSYIICYDDLYIVGQALATIDLVKKECKCCASSFNDAKIRINNSKFQNVTSFSPTTLYYKEGEIERQ